jgi:hypothetical protein
MVLGAAFLDYHATLHRSHTKAVVVVIFGSGVSRNDLRRKRTAVFFSDASLFGNSGYIRAGRWKGVRMALGDT